MAAVTGGPGPITERPIEVDQDVSQKYAEKLARTLAFLPFWLINDIRIKITTTPPTIRKRTVI